MLREKNERIFDSAPSNVSEADCIAVREQMQRMLIHPLFRSGRRCPALFQYVVEQALEKNTGLLKERIIGIEVFGRAPDYDTNADSVVRTAAAELRKRIAQYYQESGHEAEVRIELHSGSYVPDFRIAPEPSVGVEDVHLVPAPPVPAPMALREQPARTRTASPTLLWLTGLAAFLAIAAIALKPWHQTTALDKFWAPVLESPGAAILCVGQRLQRTWEATGDTSRNIVPSDPTPEAEIPLFKFYWTAAQNVVLPDVITISRLSGLLQEKGKAFRVRMLVNATFDDLRGGPAILVGGHKNEWTARLMSHWRFSSVNEGRVSWIQDRDNPSRRNWAVDYSLPYTSITEDYAIVSRAVDPATNRPVVALAGMAGYGTMAAAEFVTDPAETREIEKGAPANWEGKGLQVVLKTNIIGKIAGPPQVIATYFW
jgi:hypothetical protein